MNVDNNLIISAMLSKQGILPGFIAAFLGLSLVVFLHVTAPLASAEEDFFFSDGETLGSFAEELEDRRRKKEEFEAKRARAEEYGTFTGAIEKLLKSAGQDTSPPKTWEDFEDISEDNKAKEAYHSAYEFRMKRELKNPMKKREPFGENKLEDLEKHLEVIRPASEKSKSFYMHK